MRYIKGFFFFFYLLFKVNEAFSISEILFFFFLFTDWNRFIMGLNTNLGSFALF